MTAGGKKTASGNSFRSMVGSMYLRMFLPGLVSSLTLALANVADALAVGNQVGETGLATIGLSTPVYLLYSLLGTGFAAGGGITHSRLTAAEARDRALCHFRQLSVDLLLGGILIAVLGNVFLDELLTGLGAGMDMPELREHCVQYIQPLVTAAPLFFLNFLLYYFIRNDDDPVVASAGYTVGNILDLVLNILFVIVLRMGVRGAILATIIAQTTAALILSTHLFFGRRGILHLKAVFRARCVQRDVLASCRSSRRTGFSSSTAYLFQFLFMLIGNRLLIAAGMQERINGGLAVAVFDLVMNCSFVMVSVYQAASEAMQPLAATFQVEHDDQSLRYILRIAVLAGLIPGLILAATIAAFTGPIAALFGMEGTDARATTSAALRIFLLSTPLSGFALILTSFDQSTEQVRTAALSTLLRNAVFLLPVTVLLGVFRPEAFWWLFPVTEALSLAVILPLWLRRRRKAKAKAAPVLTRTITNDNRELGTLLAAVEEFCEKNEVPMGTSVQLQLAVEELCAVTMAQAFTGKPGEYIRVTLAEEAGPRYLLHIRNSAPYFNPLDMKLEQARKDMTAEVMDSIGVMMVRKKAKAFSYRNYQGYNVITVEY